MERLIDLPQRPGNLGLMGFSDDFLDYNEDETPDLVIVRQDLSAMGIMDGKTQQLLDSFDISNIALCNNEVIEDFQAYFIPHPTAFEEIKVTVIGFSNARGIIRGSRDDDQVALGDNAILSFPCTYHLRGIVDYDNDDSLELLFVNTDLKVMEIWGFQ